MPSRFEKIWVQPSGGDSSENCRGPAKSMPSRWASDHRSKAERPTSDFDSASHITLCKEFEASNLRLCTNLLHSFATLSGPPNGSKSSELRSQPSTSSALASSASCCRDHRAARRARAANSPRASTRLPCVASIGTTRNKAPNAGIVPTVPCSSPEASPSVAAVELCLFSGSFAQAREARNNLGTTPAGGCPRICPATSSKDSHVCGPARKPPEICGPPS
mmetsp:Transcript_73155/g.237931  ORF Transcript_73155/g.237931 Transcript_73155/m.237931 type:complete len:220 (-) Transcript_73155:546-1205(-)